eukprot:CAMPEP_0119103962 /NCGR_PEP_ID=MMETSP1180-20130426/2295_1 /TAXON_ID=3052 ORGANISM="Chlamydomonas cf sp, Strain CCMP681" /NCGR_SAMPLE_ID=MMETSP1180 /ASSEMBLY_ACC=CAM_ASM_000741 /LENGTH=59 /DNA_ID=CAMNT_0007088595 /DNA_START=243 /DNA_END=419 /DNA_ORIENTATION=+
MTILLTGAENVFKYLQVFSACCVAFAHGANDVANAVGPWTGIWVSVAAQQHGCVTNGIH